LPIARFGREIRPDFGFDQNDADRPNERESASDDRPEIQRGIEHFDLLVRFGIRDLEPGRRCCR
jgi:hypothetical protein